LSGSFRTRSAEPDRDATIVNPLRVSDAIESVKYRVYPDTPFSEVVDLMIRRGTEAVPVVGERYEVLGIITEGDALRQVVEDGRGDRAEEHESDGPLLARDIMTRAVLCVSETQPLVDAARMMANRKVRQLPVVREGELIGLITRDAVLRALHAEDRSPSNERDDDA
jgi:CBS domain-containing protein